MKGNWRDLFAFNKRERNGVFVLSFLIIMVICVQIAMPFFVTNEIVMDTSVLDAYHIQLQKDSAKWVAKNKLKYAKKYTKKNSNYNSYNTGSEKKNYQAKNYENKRSESNSLKWNPHSFNPNEANNNDWESVGLNKGQIKSINNYLDKGGVFKKKTDVSKMYVINDSQYQKMKAYLVLPDSIPKVKFIKNYPTDSLYASKKKYKKKKYFDTIIIELNSADTTSLKLLRGIGSYYARQIVYYREKLGGFHSVNQLYEIERMRAETVLKIIPFLTVDTLSIKKIHINSDKASQMVKHPYMTWNMAIQIQDYRDFSHKYKSIHDLVKNGLLNEELYSKLAPYLELYYHFIHKYIL